MQWQKAALVGVGLLGGSLGLALRQRQLAREVHGFVRRRASIAECEQAGAVDKATLVLLQAVENADLVVLCTPIGQMRELTEAMAPGLKAGAIVTDVGSVKAGLVEELTPIVAKAGAHFIGSHPMAGAEKTGVGAAKADLFENAMCVVTPVAKSPADAVKRVEELWRSVGGRPIKLKPDLHDELVSRSSHLPHVVAAELANYVLSPALPKTQAQLCANGFRDTTRIASGSPEMWRDIALGNREHLSKVLGVFIEDLQEFQHALDNRDTKAIEEFFVKAKQRRDQWCAQGASPSPE
ncbi:MAG: prephenate dehydrogenase/arogenate dehydrogenase family protein [Verrucomicrobiota bacterium]